MKTTFIEIYKDKAIFTIYNEITKNIENVIENGFLDKDKNICFSFNSFKNMLDGFIKTYGKDFNFYLILSETAHVDFCNIQVKPDKEIKDVFRDELLIRIQNTTYENSEIFFNPVLMSKKEAHSMYHVSFVKKDTIKEFYSCFKELNLKNIIFDSMCLQHLLLKYQNNCVQTDKDNSLMIILDINKFGTTIIGCFQNNQLLFPLKYGSDYYFTLGDMQFDADILEFFNEFITRHDNRFNIVKIILSGEIENNSDVINILTATSLKSPIPFIIYPAMEFNTLLSIKNDNEYRNINTVLGAIQYINQPLYEIDLISEYDTSIKTKIKNFFNNLKEKYYEWKRVK